MAARELMEDENVLSLDKIRGLFNHFFRKEHKLLNQETIEDWIVHRDAKSRLFGLTASQYRAKPPTQREQTKRDALEHFGKRYEMIFQRRHDCIHNCDRPKVALQQVGHVEVGKMIADIEFLVARCHDAFRAEFPVYLNNLGFSAVTRNRVCL
jgi:hypothetical protein